MSAAVRDGFHVTLFLFVLQNSLDLKRIYVSWPVSVYVMELLFLCLYITHHFCEFILCTGMWASPLDLYGKK